MAKSGVGSETNRANLAARDGAFPASNLPGDQEFRPGPAQIGHQALISTGSDDPHQYPAFCALRGVRALPPIATPNVKTAELSLDEAAALSADASIRPVATPVGEVALDELLPLLYKQVRSLAGPRRNLDDLVQAAAERALKALPNFQGRSAFSTWTYSIAYRTVQDHDRWYRRWTRRFSYDESEGGLEPACPAEGTEARVLQARRATRLYHHLEALPASKRAVIVLHDLEELSVREIAQITNTAEATVRSRLRDGRKKLGELLGSDPVFNPTEPQGGAEGQP